MRITNWAMVGLAAVILAACATEETPQEVKVAPVQKLASGESQRLFGAFLVSEFGSLLDRNDRVFAERAAQRALETEPIGNTMSWSNPDTGHSGAVTPTFTYQRDDNMYCRNYKFSFTIGEVTREATGTACRELGGRWKGGEA